MPATKQLSLTLAAKDQNSFNSWMLHLESNVGPRGDASRLTRENVANERIATIGNAKAWLK